MAVYVDDMYKLAMGRHRGMKMSHMMADTHEELVAMADRINVSRRWIQNEGQHDEHFDIALNRRDRAVQAGAVEVTIRQMVKFSVARRMAMKKEEEK